MADKSTSFILDALSQAVAAPQGLPLVGSRSVPGLFAATVSGRRAARLCQDDGLLRTLRSEAGGKTTVDYCAITEKGLGYLLSQSSPKQVLESLIDALRSQMNQSDELLTTARQIQSSLESLRATAETTLQQLQQPVAAPSFAANGCEAWMRGVIGFLARRASPADCGLPELCREARRVVPTLTIGQFHDGLRMMHERQQIYLHPWTGPLYEIPEPAYAMLVGHEVAYYVSQRTT